ncbi:TrbG/VirB9 family P-type conjugative transfer protein [Brucella intermedia]|uniref:TrbG/VirB9 family P-type conjugative transfer protein n=1 Tax=Brucella intermedia TaxID=94625 RepID=UPI00235EBD7B|nr:TrbG/VirB9 family P-type conjugative transfer protein [Brucella intermedia]
MRKLVIAGLMCLVPTLASAEAVPPSNNLDKRVRDATYVDGQVYRINASILRATTIEFPPGEILNNVVAGDTESLQFQSIPGGRVVAIKPVTRGINTNVTLFTNRRAYYLNVIERADTPYFTVRFNGGYTVKDQPLPDSKKVQPMGIYRRYGANLKNAITPTNVWDDGVYTYFEFYPTSPIPAIFKTLTGDEITVNSSILENKVVRVSGISNFWVLRSGSMETVVKRMNPGQPVRMQQTEARHER